ncbi:glucose 1-dehydrogenase [Nitratireductor indicus C115]|uniref:Glucose 1-dehydrogenase n=1 Tax=Nitratireductor indicus C115 TaxID=1231190 RepID=K2NU70_9HYPH|nr:glucose 1-dehydrogenase [Nitratireductor indicus]EKF41404.1 glucose 1-dehydrogenase [Nitratireductor indicus C115]SFQ72142.1 3-oxoacyl-[acyl-carrier protein] reductase [Nitratireductor indicus]
MPATIPATIPSVASLLDLTGRTVIVTGSSGGIGGGIARRLAEAGANVVCHYHGNRDTAEALVQEIEADIGGKAVALGGDLSDEAAVTALVKGATEAFGTLDAIVNNAGHQPVAGLLDITPDGWSQMMAINTAAPFLLTRAFAAHAKEKGRGGAVVNIASIEGHQPAPGHAHYAASKAAVLMFTKAAALELGALGIRVNSVSPGLIHRDGIEEGWPEGVGRWKEAAPLGRLGMPQDIGDAVLFLISDAARWVSGADLTVDGGVSARSTW